MNLYKLHTNKEELFGYEHYDGLIWNSEKSVINDDVTVYWNALGHLSRKDGPAKINYKNGELRAQTWYKDGKRHRADGPALVVTNGRREYWYEGQYYKNMKIMQTQNELI